MDEHITPTNPMGWYFNPNYNPFVSIECTGERIWWADRFKKQEDPVVELKVNPPQPARVYTQYELDFMEQSKHYYDSGRD